ncbi:dipeptidyl-peptidase 3 family protein [Roseimarinus sediminis]|uniref:dipeptidyl-peptidase 3 family protein n=1 Tax=Roseimarinus sediminis TaxID=1610899 RepID=UPI003D201833
MKKISLVVIAIVLIMSRCKNGEEKPAAALDGFQFNVEQFADLKILRYPVPGFDELSLQQKELLYYLSQAAIEGRDIVFDQNYKNNLAIRRTLEAIYIHFDGDRNTDDFKAFEVYLKRIWFSNGIHHHYSSDKFEPGFNQEYFTDLLMAVEESKFPIPKNEIIKTLLPVIFDPAFDAKRVNQSEGEDIIATSANNYWGPGISQSEAEAFYAAMKVEDDPEPVSYGLNSRLDKENGKLVEKVWKVGGTYSAAIEKIVYWLEKAEKVAENEKQKKVLSLLIEYYKTGDLQTFDRYNVAWLDDDSSRIDFVNGFIETYGDPLGLKASWESVVNFKNEEATLRTEIISNNAQWFEDHSPVDERFKKKEVKGVTAKVITATMLGGDCYPATPIGINLPNADWIRKEHGSKSVTIENITYAYDQASKGNGFLEEFMLTDESIERLKKYGFQADNLHTDLHECLGHGSGQLLPGVAGDELKAYGAAIEESRADLFALYYMGDEKMVELGLLPDMEAYKAAYDDYIRNGLMTQLTRIKLGDNVEQAHMRNRQLISRWAFEHGKADKVIEQLVKEGKTYFVINDYEALRSLFGELLAEIQRVKSEGDYQTAKELIETYAVKIDRELHAEVLERYAKLKLAPYSGFVNPVWKVSKDEHGTITDIQLDYSEGYTGQMLRYSKEHSWLPVYN